MNYKVLYRKYRPDNFENLIGQDHVKKILKNSISNDKISHAYIFSGPRGTGKTSTAKIFAKAINCTNHDNGEACGKCTNCIEFANSTDIIEIDAASNNGVDQIRELTNNIKLMPAMSKYKVYIIDEVHMLSQSAFNALLLTLEEPPSHVVFILATTNIENVPITILSRCQRFDFKKVSIDDLMTRLKFVCEKEKIEIDADALHEIAYLSDGGVRDALSLLDQLSKDGKKITMNMILSEIGTVNNIEKLIDYIEENDADNVINAISEYQKSSADYKIVIKKLIDVSSKKAIDIVKKSNIKRLTYDDYKKMVFDLTDLLNKININIDAFLLLELVLLTFVNNMKPLKTLLKKEEKKQEEALPKTILTNDISFNISARVNNCFIGAKKEIKQNAALEWKKFVQTVTNKKLKQIVADTSVLMASKDILIISADEMIVNDLNIKADILSKEYEKKYGKKVEFAALSSDEWKKISDQYIKDIKQGIKYKYIDDKINDGKEEIEKFATSVFNNDKIEID